MLQRHCLILEVPRPPGRQTTVVYHTDRVILKQGIGDHRSKATAVHYYSRLRPITKSRPSDLSIPSFLPQLDRTLGCERALLLVRTDSAEGTIIFEEWGDCQNILPSDIIFRETDNVNAIGV